MKPSEVQKIEHRVNAYRLLEKRRNELQTAIDQITMNREDDPNKTGPFTGNYRESRRVLALRICFTATRGKSPPVEMALADLGIEARLLGNALLLLLREKLEEVQNEMEKL